MSGRDYSSIQSCVVYTKSEENLEQICHGYEARDQKQQTVVLFPILYPINHGWVSPKRIGSKSVIATNPEIEGNKCVLL